MKKTIVLSLILTTLLQLCLSGGISAQQPAVSFPGTTSLSTLFDLYSSPVHNINYLVATENPLTEQFAPSESKERGEDKNPSSSILLPKAQKLTVSIRTTAHFSLVCSGHGSVLGGSSARQNLRSPHAYLGGLTTLFLLVYLVTLVNSNLPSYIAEYQNPIVNPVLKLQTGFFNVCSRVLS